MFPSWVEKMLEGMGIPGAIIFVLLLTCAGLIAYIKSLHTKADKIYGYRLTERDTLNKAMTDSSNVLADLLKVTEDRNDLTEEQARLIEKQSQAFELLKVTILAQYENIRDHNNAAATAVSAMADSIRTLTQIVIENRTIAQGHVQNVNAAMAQLSHALTSAIRGASDAQIKEMRRLLGNVTRIEQRRKPTGPTLRAFIRPVPCGGSSRRSRIDHG